jgi:tRNA-dihydrouridine synthase C
MEGMVDNVMREVLTGIARYDWCVAEFIRVTGTRLPGKTFRRVCPELLNGARTASGTAVRLQLLGADPALMAANAAKAASFDPYGIDLNFGCPAPTVNRHRGGAALLDEPELLHAITAAVRAAVPDRHPVTAKLRLGIRDTSRTIECVQALEAGGASEIVLHARTKIDGYRPPARWEWLALAREAVSVPLIANGEIWTVEDWRRCKEISGCVDVMLGRGAVADPFLAARLRGEPAGTWLDLERPLHAFWAGVRAKVEARHAPGRLKQWLMLLRRTWPEAEALYQRVRPIRDPAEIDPVLASAFDSGLRRVA